jgi:NADH dehydrogenase
MNNYIPNIPEAKTKRIVIVGGGFGGLQLLLKIVRKGFQVVLLDKNNFHQFQPLLYQVATAGLEPSAISFPFRKIIQKEKDIHFRIAKLISVEESNNEITTDIGKLKYDHLVLAMGTSTNFFGQKNFEDHAISMKTASDAIFIRNTILQNFEQSLLETDTVEISKYLNIALVGGGPTGVELAGAFAEMKKYILPKEYPELDLSNMNIMLFEASPRLLAGMSENASANALKYLLKMGVDVRLNTKVEDYDGSNLTIADSNTIHTKTVVWAAGVIANSFKGIDDSLYVRGNRIKVDRFNRVIGMRNVFVIGDQSYMETPNYPKGHPQVAQTAIQQAKLLAKNLISIQRSGNLKEFEYRDKGSMATVGRNRAVADLKVVKLKGALAWMMWSVVHLFSIFGLRNKVSVFIDWVWSYLTYDQSLRILIKPRKSPE